METFGQAMCAVPRGGFALRRPAQSGIIKGNCWSSWLRCWKGVMRIDNLTPSLEGELKGVERFLGFTWGLSACPVCLHAGRADGWVGSRS